VETEKEIRIEGIGVSQGIARARIFVRTQAFREPAKKTIAESEVDGERARLEKGLQVTRHQIREMYDTVLHDVGAENAAIFEAHLLVLEDSTVLTQVNDSISKDLVCADFAFWEVMKRYIDALRAIDDSYLGERVVDIEDVSRRVLRNLRGERSTSKGPREQHILAARDLTPSDTATLDKKKVLGFVTEVGSPTSHTAIMARSLQIPAVVGIRGLLRKIRSGDSVLIDGYSGIVFVNPTEETLEEYSRIEEQKGAIEQRILDAREADAQTTDGRGIILSANIEFPHEAEDVLRFSARGVGLFRTEFAYMNGDQPGEDVLAEGYEQVVACLEPDLVIFRTVDLGGDKLEPGRSTDLEPNPFLGWRGIRYCLQRPNLFEAQLRALLRASARGKVGIMFPLISSVGEVIEAKQIVEKCKEQLAKRGQAFDPNVQIGAMIEVPSAAVGADLIAGEVDFFSIGTNDLVQYSLAVDRINESVAHLYQPSHPAVLRLINHTVKSAHDAGIWCGICGEMAGDLNLTPLLLGLGLDEFSVVPSQVPRVKFALRKLDASECQARVKEWFQLADPALIYQESHRMAMAAYPELVSS